jgi:cytochrome c
MDRLHYLIIKKNKMKKTKILYVVTALALLLAACGGSNENNTGTDSTSAADQSAVAQNSNSAQDTAGDTGSENTSSNKAGNGKGAQLIAASDCSGCHRDREKLVGPAFSEIAGKYTTADVDKLADKIINGGSGSFGDIPMSAHPALSSDDAKEMVDYILTVK